MQFSPQILIGKRAMVFPALRNFPPIPCEIDSPQSSLHCLNFLFLDLCDQVCDNKIRLTFSINSPGARLNKLNLLPSLSHRDDPCYQPMHMSTLSEPILIPSLMALDRLIFIFPFTIAEVLSLAPKPVSEGVPLIEFDFLHHRHFYLRCFLHPVFTRSTSFFF